MRWRGRGLFSGEAVALSVHPAKPGSGWSWGVGRRPAIPLEPAHLRPQARRSSLHSEEYGMLVQLPEHILAALVILDVDDCTLRFHQGEAPVLDGSALPFLRGLLAAGLTARRSHHRLHLELSWRGHQLLWEGGTSVARARTFLSIADARALGGLSFFPGARPGCALVIDEEGASRYGGRPRLAQELAWHKMLDLVGDLGPFRARGRLTGRLYARNPGHEQNPTIIREALEKGDLHWLR